MISARAADPRSPRRRCAPRRSNSNSTRPRSLYPWWCAGPRSCAERRNAGAVMRGRAVDACGRLVASSRKLAPARPQILLLCAAVPRPVGLSCRRFDAWQLWYASCAARVPTNLGYEACLLQIAAGLCCSQNHVCPLLAKRNCLVWSTTCPNEASDDA